MYGCFLIHVIHRFERYIFVTIARKCQHIMHKMSNMGKRKVAFLFDFIRVNAFAKLQIILSTNKMYYTYFLSNNRFGHNI